MDYQNLSRKERKEIRRLQGPVKSKNILIWVVILIGSALVVVGLAFLASQGSSNKMGQKLADSFQDDDAEVISQSGIHWHPHLSIYIKGQKQEIPANIGIGTQYSNSPFYDSMMSMTDVHTHDNSGTLHWEVMSGPVKKGHVHLKAFFGIWGKTFNSNQILDPTNGGTVKMTVNDQPNTEFENYVVKDKDKIEIRYD